MCGWVGVKERGRGGRERSAEDACERAGALEGKSFWVDPGEFDLAGSKNAKQSCGN